METVPMGFFSEIREKVPEEDFMGPNDKDKKKRRGRPPGKAKRLSTGRTRKRSTSPPNLPVKRVKNEAIVTDKKTSKSSAPALKRSEEEPQQTASEETMNGEEMILNRPDQAQREEDRDDYYTLNPSRRYSYFRRDRDEESDDSDERFEYRSRVFAQPRRYRRHASPPSSYYSRRLRY